MAKECSRKRQRSQQAPIEMFLVKQNTTLLPAQQSTREEKRQRKLRDLEKVVVLERQRPAEDLLLAALEKFSELRSSDALLLRTLRELRCEICLQCMQILLYESGLPDRYVPFAD